MFLRCLGEKLTRIYLRPSYLGHENEDELFSGLPAFINSQETEKEIAGEKDKPQTVTGNYLALTKEQNNELTHATSMELHPK